MPVFRCSKCGCIENTALSGYWFRNGKPPLCSACDPAIGKWHNKFKKESAVGMLEGSDGFLYHPDEIKPGGYFHRLAKPMTFTEIKPEKT